MCIRDSINGEKLCRIIRKMPGLENVYLIILSAVADESKVNFVEFGANGCIAKSQFNKMSRYILETLDKLDQKTFTDLEKKVIGLEHVKPREITKELLAVKSHFEAILDNMTDGVLEISSEARIVYANTSALFMISIPEEKLLGSNLINIFDDTDVCF